jgi:NAD(P)-dependent dehydrogenase (short-subunit alcohol dehydrogenase family)
MFRALAAELGDKGARVNVITPEIVESPPDSLDQRLPRMVRRLRRQEHLEALGQAP